MLLSNIISKFKKKFPVFRQPDSKDCGPTCLRIISKFYGKKISLQYIRNLSETTRIGSSLTGLSKAAEHLGFKCMGIKIDYNTLKNDAPMPCILHWNSNHFVVVYDIDHKDNVSVSDPAFGLIKYTKNEFSQRWLQKSMEDEGIVLLLEPTEKFYNIVSDDNGIGENLKSFLLLYRYLLKYKTLIFQLILGLLFGSVLSLIFPFLTQSIVDVGIFNKDLSFIYLILLGQLMLFLGRMSLDYIRSWILLHLSTRINISLISDFFIKLMNLPISFFDTRITGDILQRVNDHKRIEELLTTTSLNTIFSVVNLIVFSGVLYIYSINLFLIYLVGAVLYFSWITFFLKKRAELDYKMFSQVSQEQSNLIEIVNGMQEIKMFNAEREKRGKWESLQVKLFRLRTKVLTLDQWQSLGASSINQLKDILITFFSAKLVIKGELTLGMMLSVQYIIGQLNGPLIMLIGFIKQSQDAFISMERLNEIHSKEDEESDDHVYLKTDLNDDISIKNLNFRYTGSENYIFENLNLVIPNRKVTAIVGASGSGKTTLLKILMKYYPPENGEIKIGNHNLNTISPKYWRSICGVVMQEGYIFNDTIAANIAIGDENIDYERINMAVEVANIKDFIDELPLQFNTVLGGEGLGISGGQKQRLFIARAVYKSPKFIIFDEATSALDTNNEAKIVKNLEDFFKSKTAIVIAHRLSTVKNADKIVVLKNGKVVEEGNHENLISLKGEYYNLIKNQLELAN